MIDLGVLQTPHHHRALGEVDLDVIGLEIGAIHDVAIGVSPRGQRGRAVDGFRCHDTSLGPSLLHSECCGPAAARKVEQDWSAGDISPQRVAMLGYAVKLTRTPADITKHDVASVRATGFSNRDIADIAEVIGYYAYVNRIADGLGVEPEAWIPD
jgi:hypothetical protein